MPLGRGATSGPRIAPSGAAEVRCSPSQRPASRAGRCRPFRRTLRRT